MESPEGRGIVTGPPYINANSYTEKNMLDNHDN